MTDTLNRSANTATLSIEQADGHAHICSKLAEQYKSDPVLFAALTDAAAIIHDLMRNVLKEAARICKDLDDEAVAKENRLACGAECAAAIADLAADVDAEIERLRAEVETWKTFARGKDGLWQESVRRAERLAEALAELITWFPSAQTYRRMGFDPTAPMLVLKEAKDALWDWRTER